MARYRRPRPRDINRGHVGGFNRTFYTLQAKLEIIGYSRTHSRKAAAREYNVQPSQIRQWEQNEDLMLAIPQQERQHRLTLHLGPPIAFDEIERPLFDWHTEMVTIHQHAVTVEELVDKALEFLPTLRQLNPLALRERVYRFMERNDLVLRRVTSTQNEPMDLLQPRIDAFVQSIRFYVETHHVGLESIYNMDQTSMFFDMPPRYSVVRRGMRRNVVRASTTNTKKRVTVLLLARADGRKYRPLIVYKGVFGARVAREVQTYDDNEALHCAQERAWTDLDVLNYWVNNIWVDIVQNTEGPKLLLVDSLPLHTSNQGLLRCANRDDVAVRFIPESCTALVQPLDVAVIKVFKQKFRTFWNLHRGRDVSKRMLSLWIKRAWEQVPNNVISRSFSRLTDLDTRMELE